MIKMQTQHQNIQQSVQFQHVNFQIHWINNQNFTNAKAKQCQNAYTYKNPRAKIKSARHNFDFHVDKKLERKRKPQQKSPYYLDHSLICCDFSKMQIKNEIKIEIENELIGIIELI